MQSDAQHSSKRRRITRACDYCHGRSIRCRPDSDSQKCQNCAAFAQPCTFTRQLKRRGAPPRKEMPQTTSDTKDKPSWTAPHIASQAVVVDLVDIFFELVYPIFPLFHQPTFVRRIARGGHTSDQCLSAVTTAVCALVSARVRDGAVYNPRWDLSTLQKPSAETLYTAAFTQARQLPRSGDLDVLRTHAILAIAAIQNGNIVDMHEQLCRYHGLVAMAGLHDEDNWPQGIDAIETEERRRLFWSIYTLDIFTSIVWSGVIRSREYISNVKYPAEIDDENLTESGETHTPGESRICWMAGRTFVLDLYRILEHVMMRLPSRMAKNRKPLLVHQMLEHDNPMSQAAVRTSVTQMYEALPSCLKQIPAVVCDPALDRFGFQAADNIATVQLLRMVLLSATDDNVSERCQVVREVVEAFMAIPTAYHSAISVPLLFHLGVIGQILGTALEKPLGRAEYRSIREAIESLARLLSLLDGMHMVKGASCRVQDTLDRMDLYLANRRNGQPALDPVSETGGVSLPAEPTIDTLPTTTPTEGLSLDTTQSLTTTSSSSQDSWNVSPLNLPQELLDDLSQIFDFTQMANDWSWTEQPYSV